MIISKINDAMTIKRLVLLFSILAPIFCSAQKEQVFTVDQKEFNRQASEHLAECYGRGDSAVVLFDNGCCNGLYYFIFISYSDSPSWLEDYFKSSNSFLQVGDYRVPLLTQLDYSLYYNQGLSDSLGYYHLDGTTLGSSNRFILVMENKKGKFGRVVPKEDLLER